MASVNNNSNISIYMHSISVRPQNSLKYRLYMCMYHMLLKSITIDMVKLYALVSVRLACATESCIGLQYKPKSSTIFIVFFLFICSILQFVTTTDNNCDIY